MFGCEMHFKRTNIKFIISSEKISELSVISIFLHSLHSAWSAWRIKTQLCVKINLFLWSQHCFQKKMHKSTFECTSTSISLAFFFCFILACIQCIAIRSRQLIFPQKIPILNVFELIQGSIIFIKQKSGNIIIFNGHAKKINYCSEHCFKHSKKKRKKFATF